MDKIHLKEILEGCDEIFKNLGREGLATLMNEARISMPIIIKSAAYHCFITRREDALADKVRRWCLEVDPLPIDYVDNFKSVNRRSTDLKMAMNYAKSDYLHKYAGEPPMENERWVIRLKAGETEVFYDVTYSG